MSGSSPGYGGFARVGVWFCAWFGAVRGCVVFNLVAVVVLGFSGLSLPRCWRLVRVWLWFWRRVWVLVSLVCAWFFLVVFFRVLAFVFELSLGCRVGLVNNDKCVSTASAYATSTYWPKCRPK